MEDGEEPAKVDVERMEGERLKMIEFLVFPMIP